MKISAKVQRLLIFSVLPFLLLFPVVANSMDVKSTPSNVTVSTYIAISLTYPLEMGVSFGSLAPDLSDQESICVNYQCNLTVSVDTNVNVDIFLKGGSNLTRFGGNETIPNWAYTWNSTDGMTSPSLPGHPLKVGSYDFSNKVGADLSANEKVSWMAWLDVPSDQTEGMYNNTLYFCANKQGATVCS